MTAFYEKILHEEVDFPITFQVQELTPQHNKIPIHWHESLELIQCVEGRVEVSIENEKITANDGDIVIINSNELHSFSAISKNCLYNYLKIDTSFFRSFNIDIEALKFKALLRDAYINNFFEGIKVEFLNENDYYKIKVKGDIINLMVYLLRNHMKNEKKLINYDYNEYVTIIKQILSYINKNYQNAISLERLSKEIGVSKYHLCRIFKTITDNTIVEYINYTRCENAKSFLSTGDYNICQVAEMCGFNNPSYFTKIYKRFMGECPSRR